MDSPHRQLEAAGSKRRMPRRDVLVDAVDQRSVQIEDKCGQLRLGGLVDSEPVFGHRAIGFFGIDLRIECELPLGVVANAAAGLALVFGQVVLKDLTVAVGLAFFHAGVVPLAARLPRACAMRSGSIRPSLVRLYQRSPSK